MSSHIKIVKTNFAELSAKAFYNYLKDGINEESIYVSLHYLPDSDHVEFLTDTITDSDRPEYPFDVTKLSDSDVFIGGSDSEYDVDDFRFYSQNLICAHKIFSGGVSRVIPRINWTYGETYNCWPEDNSYVLVREYVLGYAKYNVYQCVFAPRTPSLYSPHGSGTGIMATGDGYYWRYMYTIDAATAYQFLSQQWMPILETVKASEVGELIPGSAKFDLYTSQEAADSFELYSLRSDLNDSDLYTAITSDSDRRVVVGLDRTVSQSVFSFKIKGEDINPSSPYSLNTGVNSEFEATVNYDSDAIPKFSFELNNSGKGYYGPVNLISTDSDVIGDDGDVTSVTWGDEFKIDVAPDTGYGSNITKQLNANKLMLISTVSPDPDERHTTLMKGTKYNMISLVESPVDISTGKSGHKDYYVGCAKITTEQTNIFALDEELYVNGVKIKVVGVDDDDLYYIIPEYANTFTLIKAGSSISRDPTSSQGPASAANGVLTIKESTGSELLFNSYYYLVSEFNRTV